MADPMKDPRVELLRAAMTQRGRGMSIQVFRGTSRYQYGAGVGDVLKSIWKFIFPVIARGASSFLRYGGDALVQNGNVKDALKAAIKPALGTMIKTTGEEIARRVEAPSVSRSATEPPTRHSDASEAGTAPPSKQSGAGHKSTKRCRHRAVPYGVYKCTGKRARPIHYKTPNFSDYNFKTTEQWQRRVKRRTSRLRVRRSSCSAK